MTYGVYKADSEGTLKRLAEFIKSRDARAYRTANPGSCIYYVDGPCPETPPPGSTLWLDVAPIPKGRRRANC